MKKILLAVTLTQCLLQLQVNGATAEEKTGFTGNTALGTLFMYSSDNLDPRGSNKLIEDLDSAAKNEFHVLPIVMPKFSYSFGQPSGAALALFTEPPLDEAGGYAINIGGSLPTATAGIVHASVFTSPFSKAWKNPYLTGVGRESTSTNIYGAEAGLKQILGSGLSLSLVYLSSDVANDDIGQLQPDLARDGSVYALKGTYTLLQAQLYSLQASCNVVRGEYDGASNSFTKGKIGFEARRTIDRLSILPKLYYSRNQYDKIDPILAATRKTDGFGAAALLNYAAPFDYADWSLQGLVNYGRGDSNISFYDTETLLAGLFVTYQF